MIEKWFNNDIQKVLAEHRYVVLTDASSEGEYLLRYLLDDVVIIPITNEWSELEARYSAESTYSDNKVLFYVKRKADTLTYLQEYVQTEGLVVLDDFEQYIKSHIFSATGKNTNISKDKILLAAKLSEGKSLKWWQSVAEGITDPLNLNEWLLDFLYSPSETRKRMDDTVWNVFRSEVYRTINKTATDQPVQTMAKEVVDYMFLSLVNNTINGLLLDVYYQWADSAEKSDILKQYVENHTIDSDVNPITVHPDHPFAALDRKLMKMYSDALKQNQNYAAIIQYVETRTKSNKAKNFKSPWLKCVYTLATYKVKPLDSVHTYNELSEYYLKNSVSLDSAMRKIYVAWLNDEATLRPLQEYYTNLNKELLNKWYSLSDPYTPTQQNIVQNLLSDDKRTAIIVCDGLRLEIAETIVNGITDKNIHIDHNTAFSVLPSVTENGMSALFGCKEPTTNAQVRFNTLKSSCDDVQIISLDMLNDSVTAQKLVLNYGDIDQVAEKKQLNGLKDIDNYEKELRDAIGHLFRLGYEKVVMTTDHGFVITGILDEADKEPRPNGVIQKIEERYVLSEDPLIGYNNMVEKESNYFESSYQYYAKTDKPFITRGAYGYAHGGFTPQECIIPVYEMSIKPGNYALKIKIANKKELKDIAGSYFAVKLQAEGSSSDLFTQERKIKLMLFSGSKVVNTSLHTLKPGMSLEQEFELTNGIDKVVIADKETSAQIDSADIKKSNARDLDDLF